MQASGAASLALIHAALFIFSGANSFAQECGRNVRDRVSSEKLYVPAYSIVMTREDAGHYLSSTLAVHNVDPKSHITITSVDYHSRDGGKLISFVDEPEKIAPFGSRSYLVPINEQEGGFGANYIVTWESEEPVLSPIVEAVMIGGGGTQGISFRSLGRVIECRP